MTHRERLLAAARGEFADVLPFAPRLDLWYLGNSSRGTIPAEYEGQSADDIARSHGWALHKFNPEYHCPTSPEDLDHLAIGLYGLKEFPYAWTFRREVEFEVETQGERTRVTYHTPRGTLKTVCRHTAEMRAAGVSLPWIEEHLIKEPQDYEVACFLFDRLVLEPRLEPLAAWINAIGDDGLVAAPASDAASPMHHVQKFLVDPTTFFYHLHDCPQEMRRLAAVLEPLYERLLEIAISSPAAVVLWGGNFDDTITYPPYFAKHILPWLRKAAGAAEMQNKVLACHCDGENLGLMDLIADSGIHLAESVCPAPMTKVGIGEYYRRWGGAITISGGIPSDLLLEERTTDEQLDSYLDDFFGAIRPGNRFILGVADAVPVDAAFHRLVRISERVANEAKLPLV